MTSRQCLVCQGDETTLRFRSRKPTSQCVHPINVCSACIAGHIKMQVNDKGETMNITCPDCRLGLRYEDIKRFASNRTFKRYDALLLRKALQSVDDFRWCKNAKCGSGQIHEGGCDSPIMCCVSCKSLSCLTHDLPWHQGQTCEDLDAILAKSSNDAASKAYMKSNTKPCPKCRESIEKDGGCDHMTCRRPGGCGYQFCWRCLADYSAIVREGNHMHQKSCQYYAAPPPLPQVGARRQNNIYNANNPLNAAGTPRRRSIFSALFG